MLFQENKYKRALESINAIIGKPYSRHMKPASAGIREAFLHNVLAIVSCAHNNHISAKTAVKQIRHCCSELNKLNWKDIGDDSLIDETSAVPCYDNWIYNNIRWVLLSVEPQTINGVHIELANNNDIDLHKLARKLTGRKGYLEMRIGQRILTSHKYNEGDKIAAFIELGEALNADRNPGESQATVEVGQTASNVSTQSAGFYPKATLERANWDQFEHIWWRQCGNQGDFMYSYNLHEALSAEYSLRGYLVLQRKCQGIHIEIPIKIRP